MKVAVTGLNNVDNPGPGVPVIRSLIDSGEFAGEIIGLIYDCLEPGAYLKNISSKNYVIPYPSSGLDAFYERLKSIHEKEKFDVIIPTLDAELYAFVKLESKLNSLGIKMFLPTLDQLNFRAKDKLFDFFSNSGIKIPQNFIAGTVQDLYKLSSKMNYPVVVKGIFYDALIAHNFDEVLSAATKLSYKWGFPLIVQEYIKGEEYNVAALGDGTGELTGAVSMKKMYITDKGKGWAGVTIDDQVIMKLTKQIITSLKWKSGCELEFIKSRETNEYYLLEINPRFPAWVYLATAAGQNLPSALLNFALGEEVETFTSFEVGKIFIRYSWDHISSIKEFEALTINGENRHD